MTITIHRKRLIRLLLEQPELDQRSIARRLDTQQSSISRTMRRMEEQGLLVGRQVTDRGKELLGKQLFKHCKTCTCDQFRSEQ